MRTVQEVIRLAQEWVTGYSSQVPGFAGAYFFGGITQLPLDAFFPAYRDVDIVIVTTEGKRPFEENLEIDYCGLMLEVGFLGTEEHRSPEAILSDPELAPNLVSSPLLADPLNLLRPLQESTIERYAQEQWVRARCDVAKQDIFRASCRTWRVSDKRRSVVPFVEVRELLQRLVGACQPAKAHPQAITGVVERDRVGARQARSPRGRPSVVGFRGHEPGTCSGASSGSRSRV